MNSKSLSFVIFFAFVCGAYSQTVVEGSCNMSTPLPVFDIERYMGKWYEAEASNHVEEIGAICIEANYSLIGNGSVEVFNSEVLAFNNQTYTMLGYADKLNASSTEGKLVVNFPPVGAYNAPYWVMDTDYVSFSIVWSCRPYGAGNSLQTLWFLSRFEVPTDLVNESVDKRITALNLGHLKRTATVRKDCPIIE